uniref:Uncharacterized protein n=1 Tax=Gasterosteus aculeatus TaxID=69293 RepID=G3NVZ7_GASAC
MIWIYFFIPGEGGARVMSGMSGWSLPQRHYCLGERTSVAFQKSCVCVCVRVRVRVCVRVCEGAREKLKKNADIWVFDSIFGPFKKCSYFSSLGL